MTSLWLTAFGVTTIAVLGTTSSSEQASFTEKDKVEAVRLVMAWLQGKERLPGFNENYPDFRLMQADERGKTFLICDFLPMNADLRTGPRYRRISQGEYDKLVKGLDLNARYAKGGVVIVREQKQGDTLFRIEVSNHMGPRAGHSYTFTFRKTPEGLLTEGKMVEVW